MLVTTKKANFIGALLKDKTGQAIFEYSLILALISLAVLSIAKLLGSNIVMLLTNVINSFY